MTRSLERLVLDALPVTVYAVDLEGRITLANQWGQSARAKGPAAQKAGDERSLFGTPIGDHLSALASREQIDRAMETLRAGRTPSLTWEASTRSGDGERIVVLQAAALHDGRTVSGFVFTTIDITPSHRSREALIETGMALARTVSIDRVLQEVTHQLQHVTACDSVAIALAESAGEPPRLMHHSGFEQDGVAIQTELAPSWKAALEKAQPISRRTARGLEITVPVGGSEGPFGAITIVVEGAESSDRATVTERALTTVAGQAAVSIERAWLVRRMEHRRRLEAIGEIAAGVAHELRNRLFGISSAGQLLRFRVKEDPVVEKNVGRILREVERLNAMVTSLLEYGRPAPTKLRAADPDAVWDEVLESQRGLLEAKALNISRTKPRHHATCRIDPEQISHVFLNVLVNAVDAAPEGTDLTLVSQLLPTGSWRCRLRNGGPAIAADVLPRVFELFFSTKPNGTGLGLALCQRIVEEHGGSIALDSAPDSGTVASVTLPVTHAQAGHGAPGMHTSQAEAHA